ncbi:hypothetical protein WM008_20815 [Vibrio vulnificus]|uniref:hypothetical protein n=1 Tax=Vibrio vulnificus TaxID=672 RepID=UPI000CD205AA|nr:hypothetical protein [Vibrio vulnificus]AVX00315.1 hypothetical protein BJD94_10720 [Vibrio vulnificus Env1]EIX4876005.1 hypothetical protein [Vibrio vulnificus]EME0830256.1 hypothetical protein [Vibrio vulnificus]MCA3899274.1 hypothetical protein [Vibrio vulnificus]POC64774.1 hypothetical protein CRN56_18660 [Vibrio vulnificus Env1]
MQHGLLSSLLLSLSLFWMPQIALAKEVPADTVQQWLQDQQVESKVSELLDYALRDKTNELKFSLERLALPQQEVVRYVLLDKLEKNQVILTPRMALFVESQIKRTPAYQVVEKGEGYEFTVPAFNYPAIASRLIKRWKQDQSTLEFILLAEQGKLDLQTWLSGSMNQIQLRESLLLKELDSLSPEALERLVSQLVDKPITTWLPSSSVVVRFAQVSERSDVYHLLWRMKADHNSQAELTRLASMGDEQALQQVMAAALNPSLKEQAIQVLASKHPLSQDVKQFLITRMALPDDAALVAKELSKQGHERWLQEVLSGGYPVKRHLIAQALK